MYPADYNFSNGGRLYTYIIALQYIGISVSQLIMFGILILMFSNKYLKACIFIVILQLLFLIMFQITQYLPVDKFKTWLASDYMSEEDEEKMVDK